MRVEIRLKGDPAQRVTFPQFTDAKVMNAGHRIRHQARLHFKTTWAKQHTLAGLVEG